MYYWDHPTSDLPAHSPETKLTYRIYDVDRANKAKHQKVYPAMMMSMSHMARRFETDMRREVADLIREARRQAAAEPAAPVREEWSQARPGAEEAYADLGYHTAGYPAVVLRGSENELVAPMTPDEMEEFGDRMIRTATSLRNGGGIEPE